MKTISQNKKGNRKEVVIDGRTCHIRKDRNGSWYKTIDGMVWAHLDYGGLNTCAQSLLKPVKEKD